MATSSNSTQSFIDKAFEDHRRTKNDFYSETKHIIGSSQTPPYWQNQTYLNLQRENRRTMARMARSKEGSELLTKALYQSAEHRDFVFEVVFCDYLFEFMVHEFGHDVFSRLTECCDRYQLALIVNTLTRDSDHFVNITCNRFGPTSSFVILNCFWCLDVSQNEGLFKSTIQICFNMARNENSSKTLIEGMKYIKQPYLNYLHQKLAIGALFLSKDPRGKDVIMEVFGVCEPQFREEICNQLKGHFIKLSGKEWSSQVVRKCMSSDVGLATVVEEFITNSDILWRLDRNEYGKSVIETALERAQGSPYKEALVDALQTSFHEWACKNLTAGNIKVVPADDRTMYVTFSKGSPVYEYAVREFFGRAYGDSCIESMHMQKVHSPDAQPLFAWIVFKEASTIDVILNGLSTAKFTINGKHVWMKRCIPKKPKSVPAPAAPAPPLPTPPLEPLPNLPDSLFD